MSNGVKVKAWVYDNAGNDISIDEFVDKYVMFIEDNNWHTFAAYSIDKQKAEDEKPHVKTKFFEHMCSQCLHDIEAADWHEYRFCPFCGVPYM